MLSSWIPAPAHQELDSIEVSVPPAEAYAFCRHLDLASSPLVRFLFELRTLPDRLFHKEAEPLHLSLDELTDPVRPGFRILADRPGQSFVVGAIAKVWQAEIPYLNLAPDAYAAFAEPGWARVAWAMEFLPTRFGTRIELSLRFDATDPESLQQLQRYYALIGPFSRFMRRHLLAQVARSLGTVDHDENHLPLPGDELLAKAPVQVTDGITIRARPEQIWPWLVQMGCRRAGWYSYDRLDNGGEPSADQILPEFQPLHIGDELAATPVGEGFFTVLALEPERLLILGTCLDIEAEKTVPFTGELPERYLRDTWAFVLEPLSERETRLLVRIRADYAPKSVGWRSLWMLPLHHFMESRQLHNLKQRVENAVLEAAGLR